MRAISPVEKKIMNKYEGFTEVVSGRADETWQAVLKTPLIGDPAEVGRIVHGRHIANAQPAQPDEVPQPPQCCSDQPASPMRGRSGG